MKNIIICLVSILCVCAKGQEKGWVKLDYKEVSLDCARIAREIEYKEQEYIGSPFCTLIQSKEEFDKS